MAFITTSANYGIGRYGSARYGLVNVSHVPASVVATGSVGVVSPNVKEEFVSGVEATLTVNTVQVNLKAEPTGIQATFTVNAAGLNIRSINRVPISGVSATGAIEAPSAGGFEIDVTERVTASLVGTTAINTVQVNLTKVPTSVVATGTINNSLEFSNTHSISSVSSLFTVGIVSPNIKKPVPTAGFFTGSVGSLTLHTTAGVTGVSAINSNNNVTTTAVVFDFQNVRDQYSRRRTVYIAEAA